MFHVAPNYFKSINLNLELWSLLPLIEVLRNVSNLSHSVCLLSIMRWRVKAQHACRHNASRHSLFGEKQIILLVRGIKIPSARSNTSIINVHYNFSCRPCALLCFLKFEVGKWIVIMMDTCYCLINYASLFLLPPPPSLVRINSSDSSLNSSSSEIAFSLDLN